MSYQNKNYANTSYSDSIAEYSPLTAKEELELSLQIKKGGKKRREAIHKLMIHNTKLVIKIAGAYVNMGFRYGRFSQRREYRSLRSGCSF